jgi:hypothetical protein
MEDTPVDDRSIPDTALLMRRVPLDPRYIIADKNEGGRLRPTSFAFKDDRMSAFIKGEATVEQVLEGHPNFALVSLRAGFVRGYQLSIVRSPDRIPGHVEVLGRKPGKVLSAFAKTATWERHPPAAYLPPPQ